MNVVGAGRDFRSIEPKRLPVKPEPAPQRQTEPHTRTSLTGGSSFPSFVQLKSSDLSASAESKPSDETEEAHADESIAEESAEWPDDPGDIFDERERLDERSAEPEEHSEEQRRRQGQRLEALEAVCRSRLLMLDGLLDRLDAADDALNDALTDWRENAPMQFSASDTLTSLR